MNNDRINSSRRPTETDVTTIHKKYTRDPKTTKITWFGVRTTRKYKIWVSPRWGTRNYNQYISLLLERTCISHNEPARPCGRLDLSPAKVQPAALPRNFHPRSEASSRSGESDHAPIRLGAARALRPTLLPRHVGEHRVQMERQRRSWLQRMQLPVLRGRDDRDQGGQRIFVAQFERLGGINRETDLGEDTFDSAIESIES